MMTLIGDQATYQVYMPAGTLHQVRNHRSSVHLILKTHASQS